MVQFRYLPHTFPVTIKSDHCIVRTITNTIASPVVCELPRGAWQRARGGRGAAVASLMVWHRAPRATRYGARAAARGAAPAGRGETTVPRPI